MQMQFFHLNVIPCIREWTCEQVATWFQWKIAMKHTHTRSSYTQKNVKQQQTMLWIFSLIHRQPLSMSVTVFAVFTLELDHTMSTSTCFRSPYFFFGSLTHNVKCFEWICDGDWNERVCGWLWHQLDGISRHILWITFICVTWFSRQSHHRPRLTCFFFLCQWSTKLNEKISPVFYNSFI